MKAHGGYIMAAADYVKILAAFDLGAENPLLNPQHRDMMWSARYPSSSTAVKRGWFKTSFLTRNSTYVDGYEHGGSLRGTATLMFHRTDGISVALFFNSAQAIDLMMKSPEHRAILIEQPYGQYGLGKATRVGVGSVGRYHTIVLVRD